MQSNNWEVNLVLNNYDKTNFIIFSFSDIYNVL